MDPQSSPAGRMSLDLRDTQQAPAPGQAWPTSWPDTPILGRRNRSDERATRPPRLAPQGGITSISSAGTVFAGGHFNRIAQADEDSSVSRPLLDADGSGPPLQGTLSSTRFVGREYWRPPSHANLLGLMEDAAGSEEEGADGTQQEGSSFSQTLFNALNILCGVGLLTTPYAVAQAGWLSLLLLALVAVICCYTGCLLRRCMESASFIRTFPDIGQAAFGRTGRIVIAVLLYTELYTVAAQFLILEADHLSALFPNFHHVLHHAQIDISSKQAFVLAGGLLVLPIVWLRDLSALSYVSAGGIFVSLALLVFVGLDAKPMGGFHVPSGNLLNPAGLPLAIGLYAFCFSGHAVFPSLWAHMKHRRSYDRVLIVSFTLVLAAYIAAATLGYSLFGMDVREQVTLSMQEKTPKALAARLALWTVVVLPWAKLPLVLAPVALALEELLPASSSARQGTLASLGIRTGLVAGCVVIALTVTYGAWMALVGALLSTSVSLVTPCVCRLKLGHGKLTRAEHTAVWAALVTGSALGVVGTCYASISIVRGNV